VRIRIIDAFAERAFTGNPAGVCLLDGDDWPDVGWMQQVAAELNLAETAFARPIRTDGEAGDTGTHWALRWFTPLVEVDLCGHATLATTHAMVESGLVSNLVTFATRSGVLTAQPHADGTITLDFPVNQPHPVIAALGLPEALGAPIVGAYETGALGDLLVEVADEHTVRHLVPDLSVLATLPLRGVIVTAAAVDPDSGYDFVSRFFGPAVGVPEDPVTGSAHTALAPFWSARLGSDTLIGLQASPRTGLVRCQLAGDRVLLNGRAITVLDGELRDVG
jgi:PhzF family phenazine biosynthesis protein